MAVPVALVAGLLLGGGTGSGPSAPPSATGVLPAVTVTPPPSPSARTTSTCAQVISALPLVLDKQNLRLTTSVPATGLVQAWGDPPIVLRCGVAKPASLVPSRTDQYIQIDGVLVDVQSSGADEIYTIVDRAVFIEVDVPSTYAAAPMPPIVSAVRKVLPDAVCVNTDVDHPERQCTRRK